LVPAVRGRDWRAFGSCERSPDGTVHNLVAVFFGIITRQAIRRGTFTSVKELIAAIRRFIDGWNDRCQPFTWTKTPDEILAKATRKPTSDARRWRGSSSGDRHIGCAGRRLWKGFRRR
jgi:hypothetical protein